MNEQITIISPGLLGASIAAACRKRSLFRRIHVWARRPEVLLECEKMNWCDAVFDRMEESVKGSDLVVICTPVSVITEVIEKIVQTVSDGCLITDVGSTKSLICRQSKRYFMGKEHLFIGSHPMAGSEKSGLANADEALFEGRSCFVTPIEENKSEAVLAICRFWRDLGMEVSTESPEKHDEIVATISHLPHFLASALALNLKRKDPAMAAFAGQGLKDTTRIASGDADLWKAIFEQNRDELLRSLDAFERTFTEMKSALQNQSWAELRHLLQIAKHYRDDFK